MAKQDISVEDLVGMIARGELRLPEIQRDYVWRGPRVRDLLDSLYRGYPSGAILVWETEEPVPLRDMAISQATNPYQKTLLLLDGQQRLTSLSAVLRGEPLTVAGRKTPIEILFNLDHTEQVVPTEVDELADDDLESDAIDANELDRRINESTFVISTKKIAALSQWVSVSEVFRSDDNSTFLQRAGLQGFADPRYGKYSQRLARLRAIRKYQYRMDVLERTLTYEDVTDIFVRVNSLGAKLRSSDLALAQITARWRHSLSTFQAFQAECVDLGFDVDLGIHLKAMISFATGQSRFLTVGRLTLDQLQTGWRESVEGMRFAINFLKSNVGVESVALLSSPFLMITLAYYGHKRGYALTETDASQLRRWVLLVSTKGRYSRGSTETFLDQDLAAIARGDDIDVLIERLRVQFGRLDVTPEELEGKDQRSSLFKTMFVAFRAAGARDWTSNLLISLGHSGTQHKLEYHHLFPKAVLARAGVLPRDVEDLANLAFIAGRSNKKLSDTPLSIYAPDVIARQGPDALDRQAIPTDPSLWEVPSYRDFMAERRRLLADMLTRFIAGEPTRSAGPTLTDLLAAGESDRVEFKSSLRWDKVERRENKELERVVLKSIAALSNGTGGKLMIGVRNDGVVLGLADDYAWLRGDRDKFERHLRAVIAAAWGAAWAVDGVSISFPRYADVELCIVDVRAGTRPLFLDHLDKNGVKTEKLYVRTGAASSPIEGQREASAYINRRFPAHGVGLG